MHQNFRKYAIRIGVACAIYLVMRLLNNYTAGEDDMFSEFSAWGIRSFVFVIYTVAVVLLIWELSDITIRLWKLKIPNVTSVGKITQLILLHVAIMTPLVLGASHFSAFYINPLVCPVNELPFGTLEALFVTTFIQGMILAGLVIASQVVKLYTEQIRIAEKDKAAMQKELLLSKYESLKNQVNPHFLFNSFSVLNALIHQDPDKASDFLDRLSKMYRYILEHKEEQMITLDKEFECLNDYLFLLKTRHEDSILVDWDVKIDQGSVHVPTLSLQMLIENAVKHNNFSAEEPLSIRIYTEGADYLVVQNKVNRKSAPISSTKIGLENIRNRYSIQSQKQLVVDADEAYFTVKLPVLSSLNFS